MGLIDTGSRPRVESSPQRNDMWTNPHVIVGTRSAVWD
jgi:hypothetical protein